MLFIKHRCNTISQLRDISKDYGLEIDLRSYKKDLILNHEPFENGILFRDWLEFYNHKFLIMNVKEEGLEESCISLLREFKIKNYFFLDQSFPMLIKAAKQNSLKTSIRFSQFESLETVLKFKGMVDWVWVDYYEKYPLSKNIIEILRRNNFKICLVSPELQCYDLKEINLAFDSVKAYFSKIDAICTKHISVWESLSFSEF